MFVKKNAENLLSFRRVSHILRDNGAVLSHAIVPLAVLKSIAVSPTLETAPPMSKLTQPLCRTALMQAVYSLCVGKVFTLPTGHASVHEILLSILPDKTLIFIRGVMYQYILFTFYPYFKAPKTFCKDLFSGLCNVSIEFVYLLSLMVFLGLFPAYKGLKLLP